MAGPAGRVSIALAASAVLHALLFGSAPAPSSGAGAAPAAAPAPLEVRLASADAPAATTPVRHNAGSDPAAGRQPRPAEEPRYWRASELDLKPIPLTPIEPAAPPGAAAKAGRVLARVLINESGRADAVRVELAEPQVVFDEAVKTAFGAARYRPGIKGGRSVKSQMLVEITFHGEQGSTDSAPAR